MRFKTSLKLPLLIISLVGIAASSIIILSLTLSLPAKGVFVKATLPKPPEGQVLSANTPLQQNFTGTGQVQSAGDSALSGQADSRLPVRLRIPKIHVDAALESVGLTPEGDVGVPQGLVSAGWFNSGPLPGETGNAIIDGHSGLQNGIPAVFDNLYKLKKGDKVHVEDGKGITLTFVVRETRKYDAAADAVDVFSSDDGKAHLNIITCNGVWDKVKKTYSDRLVIFTDKETE